MLLDRSLTVLESETGVARESAAWRVGLNEAGTGDVPVLGADRDLFLNRVPGRVVRRPFGPSLARTGRKSRSMVEALRANSRSLISGATSGSCSSQSGNAATKR